LKKYCNSSAMKSMFLNKWLVYFIHSGLKWYNIININNNLSYYLYFISILCNLLKTFWIWGSHIGVWVVTPCSSKRATCLCWFLAWLPLWPWRWGKNVPLNIRLSLNYMVLQTRRLLDAKGFWRWCIAPSNSQKTTTVRFQKNIFSQLTWVLYIITVMQNLLSTLRCFVHCVYAVLI
jgi:hypothetical protein